MIASMCERQSHPSPPVPGTTSAGAAVSIWTEAMMPALISFLVQGDCHVHTGQLFISLSTGMCYGQGEHMTRMITTRMSTKRMIAQCNATDEKMGTQVVVNRTKTKHMVRELMYIV